MTLLLLYLLFIVVIGIIVNSAKGKKAKSIYLAIIFLFAFAYSALRAPTVGIDTQSYYTIYRNIGYNGLSELPRNTEIEEGFMLVCYFLNFITSNPQLLLILMSATISYSFYRFIKKHSENYMISSLIYVSTMYMATMNVSRQFFAISFILFAISFALDKKPIKTLLMLIIAASLHYSSIIYLPLIAMALPKAKLTQKATIIISALSMVVIPIYTTLVTLAINFFPQYARFISSKKYSASTDISVMFIFYLIALLIFGFWAIKKYQKRNQGNDEKQNLHYLFMILYILYIVSYIISTKFLIASRLIYLFQISLLIFVPMIIEEIKHIKNHKYILAATITIFVGYYMNYGYNYFKNDPHKIMPYSLIWSYHE